MFVYLPGPCPPKALCNASKGLCTYAHWYFCVHLQAARAKLQKAQEAANEAALAAMTEEERKAHMEAQKAKLELEAAQDGLTDEEDKLKKAEANHLG